MAKVITQQTFDDVVRENMAEFEMSAEEAVNDAKEQFQSQVRKGHRSNKVTGQTGSQGHRSGRVIGQTKSHTKSQFNLFSSDIYKSDDLQISNR